MLARAMFLSTLSRPCDTNFPDEDSKVGGRDQMLSTEERATMMSLTVVFALGGRAGRFSPLRRKPSGRGCRDSARH